jgi:U3 small nucleolar RNA-associated protein 23
MRHLYATEDRLMIEWAKVFERRRCGHHELEVPLSALDCLKDVVDGKGNATNKHRYVVAAQDQSVRSHMRSIPGVPLVYLSRNVMILEPMAEATSGVRSKQERSKFREGLKSKIPSLLGKRNRSEKAVDPSDKDADSLYGYDGVREQEGPKKKQAKGFKGPNPLSVLKPKKQKGAAASHRNGSEELENQETETTEDPLATTSRDDLEQETERPSGRKEVRFVEPVEQSTSQKAKRKRKPSKPSKLRSASTQAAVILTGRANLAF